MKRDIFLRREWKMMVILALCPVYAGIVLLSIFAPVLQQNLLAQHSLDTQAYRMGATSTGGQQGQSMAPVPVSTATMVHTPLTLVQDSFQRPDQQGWGTASDGQVWQGEAAENGQFFAVRNGVGEIRSRQGKITALLGQPSTNADVTLSGSITAFNMAATNIGAVVRYNGPNEWDKAYIDGANLVIIQHANGKNTTLASVPFLAQANTSYTIRFRANGSLLDAKAWQSEAPEPGAWMVHATEKTLQTGRSGIRVVLQPHVAIHITSFLVQSAAS